MVQGLVFVHPVWPQHHLQAGPSLRCSIPTLLTASLVLAAMFQKMKIGSAARVLLVALFPLSRRQQQARCGSGHGSASSGVGSALTPRA